MYIVESALFQCQHSSYSSGQVYTPNIPDFYFDNEKAAAFSTGSSGANLTTAIAGHTYIFTIPPVSAERNCTGTVIALQYCHVDRRNLNVQRREIFNLFLLSEDDDSRKIQK